MSQVFISYRQTNDEQKQRVRAFAERLRDAGVDVILDQFFLDDNPGGPNDGWPKWSSDRALKTDYVLIIGASEWYQCFEGTQAPGTGLGAACEAADIRTRIYKSANVIPNIRVVLLKDEDDKSTPDKLSPYHRFHADRDLTNIVRWINGSIETGDTPPTSIPHNLPSLQPFFGREEELRKIADALDPESRTWGALIDGPGGMGKTSLAVRAAYDAPPEAFEKIVFVSLKSRELGHAEIMKAPEDKRPRLLHDVLQGTRALLILDNLESLLKLERDVIVTFVKRLPLGCKAILTSRERIGTGTDELILRELSEVAALATLAELTKSHPALERTTKAERIELYRETRGNPLLLRWTAGQIGRGSCLTLSDALAYLRSCPEDNDPLEFIFGDLVDSFSEAETRILCVLTYFTLPTKAQHLFELAECSQADDGCALR